jgi:hypothetical protein
MKMLVLEYTGEYGIEVATFVPFIHYLKQSGVPSLKVITYKGMAPYYYFLEDYELGFKDQCRYWIAPDFRMFLPPHLRNDDKLFKESSHSHPPSMMSPPNFYEKYVKYPRLFQDDKPIFVIQNKYNSEWGGPPRNFFDLDDLVEIIENLKKRFTIVYIRSNDIRMNEYSHDDNEEMSIQLFDKELIHERYRNDVLLYEDLLRQYVNYDFNTLKCILLSQATYTLSTIGGFNFFDAYFPCRHIIYKRDTPEIYDKTFYQNQHNMFCPTPNDIQLVEDKAGLLSLLVSLGLSNP